MRGTSILFAFPPVCGTCLQDDHPRSQDPSLIRLKSAPFTWPQENKYPQGPYSRNKVAVSDGIAFTVEWSDTLTSETWSHNGVSEADVDQGDTHLVTATLPAGAGPARFVRLRVEKK